jgi:hypothetical protein
MGVVESDPTHHAAYSPLETITEETRPRVSPLIAVAEDSAPGFPTSCFAQAAATGLSGSTVVTGLTSDERPSFGHDVVDGPRQ